MGRERGAGGFLIVGKGEISDKLPGQFGLLMEKEKAAARLPAGSAKPGSWLDIAGMHAGTAPRGRRGRAQDHRSRSLYRIAVGAACLCAGPVASSGALDAQLVALPQGVVQLQIDRKNGTQVIRADDWTHPAVSRRMPVHHSTGESGPSICRPSGTCIEFASASGCSSMVEL